MINNDLHLFIQRTSLKQKIAQKWSLEALIQITIVHTPLERMVKPTPFWHLVSQFGYWANRMDAFRRQGEKLKLSL